MRNRFIKRSIIDRVAAGVRDNEAILEEYRQFVPKLTSIVFGSFSNSLEMVYLKYENEKLKCFIEMTSPLTSQVEKIDRFHQIIDAKLAEVHAMKSIDAKLAELQFHLSNKTEAIEYLERGELFDSIHILSDAYALRFTKLEDKLKEKLNKSGEIQLENATTTMLSRHEQFYDWNSIADKLDKFIETQRTSLAKSKEEFDELALKNTPWLKRSFLQETNQRLVKENLELASQLRKYQIASGELIELEDDLPLNEKETRFAELLPEPRDIEDSPPTTPTADPTADPDVEAIYLVESRLEFQRSLKQLGSRIEQIDRSRIKPEWLQAFDRIVGK